MTFRGVTGKEGWGSRFFSHPKFVSHHPLLGILTFFTPCNVDCLVALNPYQSHRATLILEAKGFLCVTVWTFWYLLFLFVVF